MDIIVGRVMIFGTFDRFHPGHRFFIESALSKGKELVVVVARDETVKRLKGHFGNSEEVRVSVLRQEFPEVTVVLGHLSDYMAVVREHRPDLVCLGYDQEGFSRQLAEEFPEIRVERVGALRPDVYKSSKFG